LILIKAEAEARVDERAEIPYVTIEAVEIEPSV